MYIRALKTSHIQPFESLHPVLEGALETLREGSILCITSKILSLSQGRVIPLNTLNENVLVRREADLLLVGGKNAYGLELTIKNNLLMPNGGVDGSNGSGHYVLYPENIQQVAAELWEHVRQRYQVKNLGVLITDSKTSPLRRGVTGIALGWCGFAPLYSYKGKSDLDGRLLHSTWINVVDGLAAAAVLLMGEGDEQTPLALIHEAPKITFVDRPPTEEEVRQLSVPMEEDLYAPLLRQGVWENPKDL